MEGLTAFIIFAGVIGTVIVVGVIGELIKRLRQSNRQSNSAMHQQASYKTQSNTHVGMTSEQKHRLEYLREQQKQKTVSQQHERHQSDAQEHSHLGEEEHYEEIVGSLGDINDEGCEDLSGVRFIAHDLAYEVGDSEQHDYTKLAKAIVLGDIINSPRFKTPPRRLGK